MPDGVHDCWAQDQMYLVSAWQTASEVMDKNSVIMNLLSLWIEIKPSNYKYIYFMLLLQRKDAKMVKLINEKYLMVFPVQRFRKSCYI